jgi:hypothetical protein
MNKLQEYEVQTNQALRAQIKHTLKRKYSNTRKIVENDESKDGGG